MSMQTALLKPQDNCLGQAHAQAHSSLTHWWEHFEEACPSCFHLQVLDKSGMCLTPEILVSGEAKNYAFSFQEAKIILLERYKGSQTIFWWHQVCTRTVNMVKGKASYRQWEIILPLRKWNPGSRHQRAQCWVVKFGSKGESPASVFRMPIWTVITHLLPKGCEQNKETLISTKKTASSKWISVLVSSVKNAFWEMSNATSELKLLSDTTCLTFAYSLNTWKHVFKYMSKNRLFLASLEFLGN